MTFFSIALDVVIMFNTSKNGFCLFHFWPLVDYDILEESYTTRCLFHYRNEFHIYILC